MKLDHLKNMAIEQAVLAALMSIDSAYDQHSGDLGEHLFAAYRHQVIFNAIVNAKTLQPNELADVVIVRDRLQSSGKLEDAGGEKYLQDILANSPNTIFNFSAYIKRLADLHCRRNGLQALQHALDSIQNIEVSAEDIINQSVEKLLAANTSLTQSESTHIDDCISQAIDEISQTLDGNNYYTFGMPDLENKLAINAGNLVVIAARPSMGKTALGVNIAHNIAKKRHQTALIFSLEMPKTDLTKRMIAAEANVSIARVRGVESPTNEDWSQITEAIKDMRNQKVVINDKAQITLSEIRTQVNKVRRQQGDIGVILVDYIQIMGGLPDGGVELVNALGKVTSTLKAIAKECECPVIVLCQLNRNVESRPNSRPKMSDIRGSGAIEQDADIVMTIYRDEYYDKKSANKGVAEISIEKNRNGSTGMVTMRFIPHLCKFDRMPPKMVVMA